MGWLEKKVTGAVQGGKAPGSQCLQQFWNQLDIGANRDLQGYASRLKMIAEGVGHGGDRICIVLKKSGVDVRGTGGQGDTVRDGDAGHRQGGIKVRRTVVDAGKHMAVQVDHETGLG